jgi:hypothetical protein
MGGCVNLNLPDLTLRGKETIGKGSTGIDINSKFHEAILSYLSNLIESKFSINLFRLRFDKVKVLLLL